MGSCKTGRAKHIRLVRGELPSFVRRRRILGYLGLEPHDGATVVVLLHLKMDSVLVTATNGFWGQELYLVKGFGLTHSPDK